MDVPNLLITTIFFAVFVLPTLLHLASNLWQRRGRSFSLIPHKKRHLVVSTIRLGLIFGAGVIGSEAPAGGMIAWGIVALVLFALNALDATDRRLTIDAETGLVKWRKISLPWWPSSLHNTGFVDRVSKVSLKSNRQTESLLGVGELKEMWTSSYNGAMSTSGQYSKEMVVWIAHEVNEYLDAFRRHDTGAARATRDRFREQFEAAQAPRRERHAARARRAQLALADKKRKKRARRATKIAKKELTRARRIEKFGA